MALEFTKFESFLNAVEKLTLREILPTRVSKLSIQETIRDIKILGDKGKSLDNISDLLLTKNGDVFDILADGTLIKVNLYIAIQDINQDYMYKYHVSQCRTITSMIDSGRGHRYKRNNRTDGTFYYQFTNYGKVFNIEENQKLDLCKNCLGIILNDKYPTQYDVNNFNLKEFHENNRSIFDFDTSELEKGENAVANEYVEEWNKISKYIRERQNYTCQAENCGFKARNNYERRFIHTHHQNGDKTNNTNENLTVLCIKCHSEVDEFHTHINQTDDYRKFIELR